MGVGLMSCGFGGNLVFTVILVFGFESTNEKDKDKDKDENENEIE